MHLVLNAFSILSFGPYLLEGLTDYFGDLGPLLFTLFFLISIVVADIPDLLWHRHNPYYSSVGASGGGAAIIAAAVVLFPDLKVSPGIPGVLFVIGYFIASVVLAFRKNSQLAHLAHATGTAFGVAIALILTTTSASSSPDSTYSEQETATSPLPSEPSKNSDSFASFSDRLAYESNQSWANESVEQLTDYGLTGLYRLNSCNIWTFDYESDADTAIASVPEIVNGDLLSKIGWSSTAQSWVALIWSNFDTKCMLEAERALRW